MAWGSNEKFFFIDIFNIFYKEKIILLTSTDLEYHSKLHTDFINLYLLAASNIYGIFALCNADFNLLDAFSMQLS